MSNSNRHRDFRNFLTERFTAVAVEVFGELETIVESYYEENKRLRNILHMVLSPEMKLPRIGIGQYTGANTGVREQPPEFNLQMDLQMSKLLPKKSREERVEYDISCGSGQQQRLGESDKLIIPDCVKNDPEENQDSVMPPITDSFNVEVVERNPCCSATLLADEVEDDYKDHLSLGTDAVLSRSEEDTSECQEPQKHKKKSTKKVQSKDVAILLKVKYQNTKKYIRLLSGFSFLDFIAQVKYKFGLPDATELDAFDETSTVVEEDIFSELIEASPDLCLTVRDRIPHAAQTLEEDIILEVQIDSGPSPTTQDDISEEDHSASSLTDTNTSLSASDNDRSSRIENRIPIGRRTSSSEVTPRPATEASESEAAKEMVKNALLCKPGGEDVIKEYKAEKSLTHRTRRQLVNILAGHMTESHGRMPSRRHKERYALGIIALFPSLKDPFSPKGYEHFYDAEKGTGYLAWRLKTMSRNTAKRPAKTATVAQAQGPKRRRLAATLPEQLDGGACREAISFLIHSHDEASVFQKMKITFQYRQDLVHDPQRATDVFKTFPRFLDVKGLLNQDFLLLFGAETASKMLERWDTTFRPKVIDEAKHMTQSVELCRLLKAAEKLTENDDTTWDSDMASLLLLLHLLPPTAGWRRTKISPSDAVDKMLHFHKSSCSLDEHLQRREGRQPYILAVGRTRNRIDTFYIVVDKQLIPCQATSSLGAFDELFKSHYVFNLSYDEYLGQLFTFVQTTVYNIDVATTNESPRVREFRAKIFN
uniref:uncharacterized protein LOC124056643 isoform X2 n=1 Tax=Scatophagus argus TaxID=75038 RepID=UPI001ED84794|nr:uncharacterized protein LOC124056643 isoform X2 [Scatophagus argus]